VSIQVSGSVTIFNTGPHDIQAFDLVMWEIPTPDLLAVFEEPNKPNGLPQGKQPFWTVPMRIGASYDAETASTKQSMGFTNDVILTLGKANHGKKSNGKKRFHGGQVVPDDKNVWEHLQEELRASATNPDEFKKRLEPLLTYFLNGYARYTNRVIGIALSKAKSGENFDILLQKAS
jgi:hypothetical protein